MQRYAILLARSASILALMTLGGCTTAEPIVADSDAVDVSSGLGSDDFRTVPLAWHGGDDWIVDPSNGTVVRRVPCGQVEPSPVVWSEDVPAESLPQDAQPVAAWLSLLPCQAQRLGMPASRPWITIDLVDAYGAILHSVATQDPSVSVAEYAALHRVEIDLLSLPKMDRAFYRAVVRVESEHGLNAFAGMRILGMRVRYTHL